MPGIQHEWALNPVTALEFCSSINGTLLLLVGEGVYLKVFEAETSKQLAKCQVFEAQAIHGLSAEVRTQSSKSFNLAVWGGKSFVLLDTNKLESIISCDVTSVVSSVHIAPDWILDATISPFSGSPSCVLVTAHSAAVWVKFSKLVQKPLLETLSSPSQSILYSAHIVWLSVDKIMVAAGTVFGEIEIITWDLSDIKGTAGRLVFTFTGHEGSIFGVQISSEIRRADGLLTRLLASCSDDRTIRIWDLTPSSKIVNQRSNGPETREPLRETGFGENGVISDQKSPRRCVAVVMGHTSRIWRVKFITSEISSSFPTIVNLLSFGEDSTCQQWALSAWGEERIGLTTSSKFSASLTLSDETAVLSHIDTYGYNSGKHLWSAALAFRRENTNHLATGGADGKVSIYNIIVRKTEGDSIIGSMKSSEEQDYGSQAAILHTNTKRSWKIEDVVEAPPLHVAITKNLSADENDDAPKKRTKPLKIPKDAMNRYCFAGKTNILVTTSFGRIMLGSTENPGSWEELRLPGYENNDLGSYSVLLGLVAHNTVLLADAKGTIYIYRPVHQITELCRVKGKVAALLDVTRTDSIELCILVTTLGSVDAQILQIDSKAAEIPTVGSITTIELPKNFIVTSAGDINGQLVLGSRSGMLAVYLRTPGKFQIGCDPLVHGNDAITAIVSVPYSERSENAYLLTTSRNGTYSLFCLVTNPLPEGNTKIAAKLVHQSTPPLGPMIESAWFEGSDLFLFGFKSKNFIVWNETRQQEITNVECGGAHRTYTYRPIPGGGGAGLFAYTKASRLCLHLQMHPSHSQIKFGGHGREIKACARSSRNQYLIATGAEDTTIRIWREQESTSNITGNNLECCAVIQKHTAGIQHLEWFAAIDTNTDYLFSAGGNEEFYVWRITSVPGFGLGVVCEATLMYHSLERDLRITSFDVKKSEWEGRPSHGKDEAMTETAEFTLSLAYSDSTIKQYVYSPQIGFKRTAQGRYTSACLTQITSPIPNHNYILTAATDGHIAIWSCPYPTRNKIEDLQLLTRVKIHQSAILSLSIRRMAQLESFVLSTGGDDNSLALTLFDGLKATKRVVIPSAHAAAITGVEFMEMSAVHRSLGLWTVGGDQRVKRWTVDMGSQGGDLVVCEMQDGDDVWCSIPDAGGLVRLHRREQDFERCLIWGVGMEIVKVQASSGLGRD